MMRDWLKRMLFALFAIMLLPTAAMAERYLDKAAMQDAQSDIQQQPQAGFAWSRPSCLRYRSSHPNLLILGDSIFDGWSGYLLHVFPKAVIDAKVGRQFSGGLKQYQYLMQYPGIRAIRTIVVELGTNGTVTASQVAQFMGLAGTRQVIFIVPEVPRPWEQEVQNLYFSLPQQYPNVQLEYWNQLSTNSAGAENMDYFWGDGVHPNWAGIQVMVNHLENLVGGD